MPNFVAQAVKPAEPRFVSAFLLRAEWAIIVADCRWVPR